MVNCAGSVVRLPGLKPGSYSYYVVCKIQVVLVPTWEGLLRELNDLIHLKCLMLRTVYNKRVKAW